MRDFRKFCRPKIVKNPLFGDVIVQLKTGELVAISNYKDVKKFFKKVEVVGESNTIGNIMIHNSETNEDKVVVFDYWLELSDNWELTGLYGITTYEESNALDGDLVILANGHTLIISPDDYSKVSDNWEQVDTISKITVNAVDLGLPSGLLWADRNVGADSEEEDGAYFSWGNIDPYYPTSESFSPYSFDNSTYAATPGASIPFTSDMKNADFAADSGYDAARENMGGSWRMPTATEFQELYDNTDSEYTTINGVEGRKFMKKSDHSVYVFFPCCGYGNGTSRIDRGSFGIYWSSSLYSQTNGRNLGFSSSGVYPQINNNRFMGYSIRPVKEVS